MCGFVALIDRRGRAARAHADVLDRMAKTIRHRGPDDEGRYYDGALSLHHLRLSIIDLAGGHQPMTDGSGELTIVFNGEIYNYVELRTALEAEGAIFRTRSDTEVILALYALHGEYGFGRLIGMFAFFLYDRRNRRGLVARDHFGIKPVYYQSGPGHLAFASEIKALLAHPEAQRAPDAERLADYMTLQLVPDEGTLFAGVRKVLPGHLHIVDLAPDSPSFGEIVRDVVYWEPTYPVDFSLTEERAVDEVRALVEDSVRMQVRADVPLGAHLSGGTDSSIVSLLAARHCPQGLNLYHGRFAEGPEFDEAAYARAVAERIGPGGRLVEIVPDGDTFADLMPRLIWHMDEPVAGPGLYPQYMVSARARQDVKVALGGQGGDELFAGYTRYLVAYLEQALKGAVHQANDEGEHILSLATMVPNLPELKAYVPLLRRFWQDGLFGPMDARYFRLIDRLEDAGGLLTSAFRASMNPERVFESFRRRFNHPETSSYLNKMLHFDLTVVLPALLHVEDRVSMAVSLESRVPLLDWRIADLAGRIPPRLKFPHGRLKHLLRAAFRDVLPQKVHHRKDKMGFPVPLHHWARAPGRTADLFRDTLASRACRERGLFEPAAVEAALDRSAPFSRKLWGVLCLELWFQTFIDGAADAPIGETPATPDPPEPDMPFDGDRFTPDAWRIRKIGVIGPGIVGMPMAALLAQAARDGAFEPDARVVVVQRRSPTSGWKVDAINAGRSPIGGVEPDLERIIGECTAAGRLSASDDYGQLADCDLVLVCVQTDKDGLVPDYGPLDGALSLLAAQLAHRPAGNVPVVAIESTLAPSSMTTVVRAHFRKHGLEEGRDVLLGNSPNRVMPGRLIERVAAADKLIGGLSAETPVLISSVYRRIVTQGTLHPTTSMTAEIVKTLENAYRDVRIAFAAEVVRYCDARDLDFFALRDAVNAHVARLDTASSDAAAVPVGALLVPMIGVGGHCLPKDGILLRWRYNARYPDRIARSLIHLSRVINDESPDYGIALAERRFGAVSGRRIAVLGAAYRADSDDTRNAPALTLCARLRARGCDVVLHDPFVRPDDQNLLRTGLDAIYTQDLDAALAGTALAFVCQAHQPYREGRAALFAGRIEGVIDGCNAFNPAEMAAAGLGYTGIGRGRTPPDAALIESVVSGFRAMEVGVARELRAVVDFLNAEHGTGYDRVDFEEVRRLAATCVTGCDIAAPGPERHFFDTGATAFHSTLAAVNAG